MATRKTPTRKTSTVSRTRTAAKGVSTRASAPAPKKAARPAAQGTSKPAAPATPKPTAKPPVKAASGAPAANDKPAKARKPKMVRDSFTMPKAEYAAIDTLKERAAKAGRPAKKSELLRAGVKLLEGLAPAALKAALEALPAIKTGRPAKA